MKLTNHLLLFILPAIALAEHVVGSGSHFSRRHSALAKRGDGAVELSKRQSQHARWSWYDGNTGQKGSCGDWIRNDAFVVAMNQMQNGRNEHCGKTITMSWRGKTTQAVVADQCPGCPYGGLDLTPGLFKFFADLGVGIIPDGAWWFSDAAPPQPPAPPKPTTTWKPPPPPPTITTRRTTTTHRPTTTSTSTTRRTSTSSSTSSSTSTSSTSSSSARLAPITTPTPTPTPTSSNNLGTLNRLLVQYGDIIIDGAAVSTPVATDA